MYVRKYLILQISSHLENLVAKRENESLENAIHTEIIVMRGTCVELLDIIVNTIYIDRFIR